VNLAAIYHEAKSKYAYAYDKETVHVRIRTGKDEVNDVKLIYGDPFHFGPKSDQEDSYEWKVEDTLGIPMLKEYSTGMHDYWFCEIKPKWKRAKYAFLIKNQQTQVIFGSREIIDLHMDNEKIYELSNFFNFPYVNHEDIYEAPEWVEDTIWYQIFPERFSNGDKALDEEHVLKWGSTEDVSNDMFFGGDIRGVINQLDYIQDLGFTGIYFTPIFQSPSSHKYDTEDYYLIDPHFGTNETFKELVQEAHKRGIRIMLDAVFNHCGWQHPFWQDVIKNGKESKYYDCFFIEGDSAVNFPLDDNNHPDIKNMTYDDMINLNYATFAFTPFMPKWNTDNDKVKEYLIGAAKYWIEEYDIDGWRLDVSNEVSHQFWREFRKEIKGLKKDVVIIGENWDEAFPWLHSGQFDSTMNYDLLMPIWSFFKENTPDNEHTSPSNFIESVNKVLTTYPKNILKNMFNLVDCHDTKRILTVCNNNIKRTMLAFLFQFTFPGTPSIYYGSEVGLDGGHDPLNRKCMIWEKDEQNNAIKNHIKTLIDLRKEYKAFNSTELRWLDYDDEKEYLIYKKVNHDQDIFVFINNNNGELFIPLPEELINKSVQDVYNKKELNLSHGVMLEGNDFLIISAP